MFAHCAVWINPTLSEKSNKKHGILRFYIAENPSVFVSEKEIDRNYFIKS